MGQYTSYYLYQKYEKIGNQDWLPAYPNIYSVDGDGTMPYSARTEDDPACGYVPPELYRWVNLDPTTDYYCYTCGKVTGTYGTGNTAFSVECDTSTAVTSADTSFSNVITYASIGDCVNEISTGTFRNQLELTGVTIPNTVTSIGASAFTNCQSMIDCMLPDTVTSIGNVAFSGCVALNSFVLWDTVISLGSGAFRNCDSLVSINIPSGLTIIPNYCFDDCGALSEITIPSGVDGIGIGAFRNCNGLVSITALPDTAPTLGASAFTNTNDCPIYVKCDSYYSYVLNNTWANYAGRVQPIPPCEEPPLPSTLKYLGFYDNSAYTVDCTSSSALTSGETRSSLPYSGLTKAIIGGCVNEIGTGAFYGCEHLTSITVSDKITSIGNSAFYYCTRLPEITIPSGVTSIGDSAFRVCSGITSIIMPDTVTSLGDYVFQYCTRITNVNISTGVTNIGVETFSNCDSITSISIPDSVETIGNGAFSSCDSLASCTFGENSHVESIGNNAFFRCPLVTIDIPDSVETIGGYAFSGCSSLTSVTIGSGITSIGQSGFYDCDSLHYITCKATTPPTIGSLTFYMEVGQYAVKLPIYSIQVPCDSVDAYKSAQYWSEYADKIIGIPPCSTPPPVDTKLYATYTGATSYEIQCNGSGELTSGETNGHTTAKAYMLTAQIGSCVTSIGDVAFNSATMLISVSIPDTITAIGSGAFEYCRSLSSITIPSGVTVINSRTFAACGITGITIPSGVTYIGTMAFFDSRNLTSVTCLATVPPTLKTMVFDSTVTAIYVPAGSVSAYQSATNWSSYASIIQPIT